MMRNITLTLLCLIALVATSLAQTTVKLKVTTEANGNTEVVEETFSLDDPNDLNAALEERGIGEPSLTRFIEKEIRVKAQHKEADMPKVVMGVIIEEQEEDGESSGIVIKEVMPDFGAAKAGLEVGDIITSANGTKLEKIAQIREAMEGVQAGDVVKIGYVRDGKSATADLPMMAANKTFQANAEKSFKKIEKHIEIHAGNDVEKIEIIEKEEADMPKVVMGVIIEEQEENGESSGIVVKEVMPDFGAAKAGLEAGDIITSANGTKLEKIAQIREAMEGVQAGDVVKIEYVRDSKSATADLPMMAANKVFQAHAEKGLSKIEKVSCSTEKSSCSASASSCDTEKKHEDINWLAYEKKGFLGVLLDVEAENVTLEDVVEGGAAEKAGLAGGDIIQSINGKSTPDLKALKAALKGKKPGKSIKLSYEREGKTYNTKAKLGSMLDYKIETTGAQKMTYIGITLDFEPVEKGGLRIKDVMCGSPAKAAKLQEGDILTGINNDCTLSYEELKQIMQKYQPNDKAKLHINRDGQDEVLKIKFGERYMMPQTEKVACESSCESSCSANKLKFEGDIQEIEVDIRITELGEEEVARELSEDMEEMEIEDFNVYPNPNDGTFNIDVSFEEAGDVQVAVFNQEGKRVYEQSLASFSGNFKQEIDLSNEPKGLYFVRIVQGKKFKMAKIVIQ